MRFKGISLGILTSSIAMANEGKKVAICCYNEKRKLEIIDSLEELEPGSSLKVQVICCNSIEDVKKLESHEDREEM